MNQYPYTLWLSQSPSEESTKDADGYFNESEPDLFVQQSVCRNQVNTGGKTLILTDSKPVVFSALIHLPLTAPNIAVGTQIEVRDGDQVRQRGTVIGFNRGQLHCRLWV